MISEMSDDLIKLALGKIEGRILILLKQRDEACAMMNDIQAFDLFFDTGNTELMLCRIITIINDIDKDLIHNTKDFYSAAHFYQRKYDFLALIRRNIFPPRLIKDNFMKKYIDLSELEYSHNVHEKFLLTRSTLAESAQISPELVLKICTDDRLDVFFADIQFTNDYTLIYLDVSDEFLQMILRNKI